MDANGNAVVVWRQYDGTTDCGGTDCRQIFVSEYRNNSWTHPADLTDNISLDGQNAERMPQVAMDANDNALLVWSQFDGTTGCGGGSGCPQIFVSEYRNNSWTHPLSLTDNISPDGNIAYYPQVAIDDNGNALVVWSQYDGVTGSPLCNDVLGCEQIFVSEYRNNRWTHPASLTGNISPDFTDALGPQVAMDANGEALVAWQQSDSARFQIFLSEYRNNSWTHPASLSDNISLNRYAASPQVAMDGNGNAMVVWYQDDGTTDCGGAGCNQIFVSEYRNGSWTHPASLTDNISPDGESVGFPQVAMDGNGNAVVVWPQDDGTTDCGGSACTQIFVSEYRNGSWTHPADLTDNISPDGSDAYNPEVAMDANGNALVGWRQKDGTTDCGGAGCYQIYVSEYRNGSWTHPADLTDNISPDGHDAFIPQVAMDANGNAVVVWRQKDGTTDCGGVACEQIFLSEYR